MSLIDSGAILEQSGRSTYLSGPVPFLAEEDLSFEAAVSIIAGIADGEFTGELTAIPSASEVVSNDNDRFSLSRSFRRYERRWLPHLEATQNGAEFAQCGDPSWPSAIGYPYSFLGGSHKSLLSRTRSAFDLTQAWGLVDEDGIPFRVIGIPTPAHGFTQGAHIGMSLREQWKIISESRDPTAIDTHRPLAQHIADGLEQLGVRRLFLPGYSDGGLMALLIGDVAATNQHTKLDVLGISSGNPAGGGRSHPWLGVA